MDTIRPRIILASSSPRRKMLLTQAGFSFDVIVSNVVEQIDHPACAPEAIAEDLALQKAAAVAANIREALILGADTIVVEGTEILGKPEHAADAAQMLRRLSGKAHRVITGVALVSTYSPPRTMVRHASTSVKFASLSEAAIAAYVASGEPLDKAGAYGIQGQGALFVEWIHGCYNNVVGLPLFLFGQMLHEMSAQLDSGRV